MRRKIASGLDPTPHEFRHFYASHLRATGVDWRKFAERRVETMLSIYAHALERSHAEIRNVIG